MPKVKNRKVALYTTLPPQINDTLNKLALKADLSRPDIARIILTRTLSTMGDQDEHSSIEIIKNLYDFNAA